MPATVHRAIRASSASWLSYGACALGALACFAWLRDSIWNWWLVSFPSRLFPPLFSLSFAAGWLAALAGRRERQEREEGAIRSQASVVGMVTAAVVCAVAYATSKSAAGVASSLAQQPHIALACFALAVLPSALFSNIGAGLASAPSVQAPNTPGRRSLVAAAISGFFPLLAAAIWPVTYGVGKMLEKPATVFSPSATAPAQPTPAPRYSKPAAFDAAHAWKLRIASEQVVPNVVEESPFSLSADEKRLAFLTHGARGLTLTVRHLYDSDQDRLLPLPGGAKALAWSRDQKRIVGLSAADGTFFVSEPDSGRIIQLPIPKINPSGSYGLAWWRSEEVLVFHSQGRSRLLSLDTLKLVAGEDASGWKALALEDRNSLSQEAISPSLRGTPQAALAYLDLDARGTRALVAQDNTTAFARFLCVETPSGPSRTFSNRDGSILFVAERGQLRILCMGLRESSPLRFKAASESDFPMNDSLRAPLARRAVRLAVTAPVVNPLNGKTVAGDGSHIKGYARIASVSGKTCEVWIEQERQPIQQGDVLMDMTAIQGGNEYTVSHEWWAVISEATSDQSIPLQIEAPMLAPAPNSTLPPLPGLQVTQTTAMTSTTAKPDTLSAPSPKVMQDPPTLLSNLAKDVELLPTFGSTTPKNQDASTGTPERMVQPIPKIPPPVETDEDKIRKFIKLHHDRLSKRDINGLLATYSDPTRINGSPQTLKQVSANLRDRFSQSSQITESVNGPIEIRRGQNNQYSATYAMVFDIKIPWADHNEQGNATMQMDLLLTANGLQILGHRMDVQRVNQIKKR